jgi:hypothetical protein
VKSVSLSHKYAPLFAVIANSLMLTAVPALQCGLPNQPGVARPRELSILRDASSGPPPSTCPTVAAQQRPMLSGVPMKRRARHPVKKPVEQAPIRSTRLPVSPSTVQCLFIRHAWAKADYCRPRWSLRFEQDL